MYGYLDDVMIAKKNDYVVCSQIVCIKNIPEKLFILPDYPENIDHVCFRFCDCFANIYSLFSSDLYLQNFRLHEIDMSEEIVVSTMIV